MSAYICNPEHIGLLAAYGAEESSVAKKIAEELARANIASVAHRYPNDKDGDRPGPCGLFDNEIIELCKLWAEQYFLFNPGLKPVEIISLVNCLDYQSCEPKDWVGSYAYVLLTKIRDKAIKALPGYDQAAWDWTASLVPDHIEAFYHNLNREEA